jgi:tryptophan synthase alpha chain
MSRLSDAFARDDMALVAYLCAGYPDPAETVGLVTAAVEAGADVIELGVPFSDPLGDGPVIQECGRIALAAGTTLPRVLDLVAEIRVSGVDTPIALMGYVNPFLRYGYKRLADACAQVGVDGLIIPDVPAHQADDLLAAARPKDVDTVFFAAMGSPDERLAANGEASRGFLYCLATNGVTGVRADLDPRLTDFLARLGTLTDTPRAVGFGISTPEHVARLRGHAEGVIVGSALARAIGAADDAAGRIRAVRETVSALKAATR